MSQTNGCRYCLAAHTFAELAAVRDAGYSDPQILAIVALAVQFLLTNYLNDVIEPDIDTRFVESTA